MRGVGKHEAENLGMTKPGEWVGPWELRFAHLPTKTEDGWVWFRSFWRRVRGPMYWDMQFRWYERRLIRPTKESP